MILYIVVNSESEQWWLTRRQILISAQV